MTTNRLTEIGEDGYRHFDKLLTHVYQREQKFGCTMRIAPSLVMRSECELLRISAPRFVYRAILDGDRGFLDLRRMALITDAFRQFGKRTQHRMLLQTAVEAEDPPLPVGPTVLNTKPICTGLLAVPQRLIRSNAIFLTTKIANEFGEIAPLAGVPVINMTSLSGGLCAQVCVLTAMFLLSRFTKTFCGLIEITTLAKKLHPDRAFELRFSGLTGTEIEACLESKEIGLSSAFQGVLVTEKTSWFIEAIRDYIVSGFPVILKCDRVRLKQTLTGHPAKVNHQPKPHCVVVVGIDLTDLSIYVNDPAELPFTKLSIAQIEDIRLRFKVTNEVGDFLINALPGSVKLHLLQQFSVAPTGQYQPKTPGLYDVSEGIRSSQNILPHDVGGDGQILFGNVGCFRLLEIEDILRSKVPENLFPDMSPWVQMQIESFNESVHSDTSWPQWVWVQYRKHPEGSTWAESLWIWDASISLEGLDTSQLGLRLIVERSLLLCVAATRVANGVETTVAHDSGRSDSGRALKISVVSSFQTSGMLNAFKAWPGNVAHCELYTLMAADAAKVVSAKSSGFVNAVEVLAQCDSDHRSAARLFQKLDRRIKRIPDGVSITSFATYIPEISGSHESGRQSLGIAALKMACKIAARIRNLQQNVETTAVEFVCGTRVDEVWKIRGKQRVCGTVMDREEAMLRLFEGISKVSIDLPEGVILAAEVEPGLLNVLNSAESLLEFCKRVERYGLSGKVGLNVDISHFMLCGINPSLILKDGIAEHVVHAHIAGHAGKGHLADLRIGKGVEIEKFLPWIVNLGKLRRMGAFSRFDGLISIEAEACADAEEVSQSVRILRLAMHQARGVV